MNVAQFKRKLEVKQKALAKFRDDLREMETNINEQTDSVERAIERFQDAIDALSELV